MTSSVQMLIAASGGGPVDPIPAIVLSDERTHPFPGTASALLTLNTDGTVYVEGTASSSAGNWYLPTTSGIGASPGYWAKVTVLSGDSPSSGTTGTWLALSSPRTWYWFQTGLGAKTATIRVEIASSGSGAPVVGTESSVSVSANVTA